MRMKPTCGPLTAACAVMIGVWGADIEEAEACSCPLSCDNTLQVSTEIPEDAVGIPWILTESATPRPASHDIEAMPEEAVEVLQLVDGDFVPISYTIEDYGTFYLIVPESGFSKGGRFRVTTTVEGEWARECDGVTDTQIVEFDVVESIDTSKLDVELSDPSRSALRYAGGEACYVDVESVHVDLRIDVPFEYSALKDALFYRAEVDDAPVPYKQAICDGLRPGSLNTFRTLATFPAQCEDMQGFPESLLELGAHEATVTVYLPGSEFEWTSDPIPFDLTCESGGGSTEMDMGMGGDGGTQDPSDMGMSDGMDPEDPEQTPDMGMSAGDMGPDSAPGVGDGSGGGENSTGADEGCAAGAQPRSPASPMHALWLAALGGMIWLRRRR